ncbi:protein phosphatase type 1 complex subunit Hex2/Reg1 [Histoplasma capsulatum var. duboisii H88]|uniref:Protein phosphatase type 1 complex subunit Hex2/Reg1 n=1 Tax=Ajellomyces capsulatus (strain H88) TaxID=544711 RepID=F0UD36_AJEC8|nr:protein phosphatase type 1 complex subunit Hex2/Reg1 [Histoplasma capsulatum var. duboisii H88]QSS49641.1 protein phosphatase type 1 complex subunit Hex2/Reg1 [Histoplasma capsulatum var. duboisii H88]
MAAVLPVIPERTSLPPSDHHRRKRNKPSIIETHRTYIKSPQPECYPVTSISISSESSSGRSSPIFSSIFVHTSPPPITLPPTPEEPEDDDILFPSYDTASYHEEEEKSSFIPPVHMPSSPSIDQWRSDYVMPRIVGDDASIEDEPTRHVDYLSHDWKEEDIWSSWRYIASRRDAYNNGVRLENAVWRTWTKAKHRLGTVTPESLNWLKDCDVTWLYGPLQTASKLPHSTSSPPPTRLSPPSPFLNKKPILKKRTASQTILQRFISTRTLLSHAGAILQAREADNMRNRPGLGRSASDYYVPNAYFENSSSSRATTVSPGTESPSERRHISFNDEVSQCIAVEGKDDYYDDMDDTTCAVDDDDDMSEDSVLEMRQVTPRPPLSSQSTPRSSFSSDSKTIAPLPPTTLKYRRDTPEPDEVDIVDSAAAKSSLYSWWPLPVPRLSRSSSTETLRPSKKQHQQQPEQQPKARDNFLLDDEGDGDDTNSTTSDMDMKWRVSSRKVLDEETLSTYSGPWFTDSHKRQWNNNDDAHGQYHNYNYNYTHNSYTNSHTTPTNNHSTYPNDKKNNDNRSPSYLSSRDQFLSFDYDDLYTTGDKSGYDDDDDDEADGRAMNFGFIGKVVDTVNTARDIAHVIWNVGWRS